MTRDRVPLSPGGKRDREGEYPAEADALVLSDGRITTDSFDPGGRLALISQFGAGFNHIDLAAATRHGVAVTNTPQGVRRPVAVSILTLIFALTTRLFVKASLTGRGAEGWAQVTRHNGIGLTGKTLGLIGVGNIGAEMFRLAAPLGMKFLAHDPDETGGAGRALGLELTGLEVLFRPFGYSLRELPPQCRDTPFIVSAAPLRP